MTMNRPDLSSILNFKEADLAANRSGMFSDMQREIVAMLTKITRANARPTTTLVPTLTSTGVLPQIHAVTGRVHTLSETHFVRRPGALQGMLIETFHLIVHGEDDDVDLPITETAMMAFDPNTHYTVYYYMNKDTPTLLSVQVADEEFSL